VSSVSMVMLFFAAYSAMVLSFAPLRLISEVLTTLNPFLSSHSMVLVGMFSSASIWGNFLPLKGYCYFSF